VRWHIIITRDAGGFYRNSELCVALVDSGCNQPQWATCRPAAAGWVVLATLIAVTCSKFDHLEWCQRARSRPSDGGTLPVVLQGT
jgi:hypothetical protein